MEAVHDGEALQASRVFEHDAQSASVVSLTLIGHFFFMAWLGRLWSSAVGSSARQRRSLRLPARMAVLSSNCQFCLSSPGWKPSKGRPRAHHFLLMLCVFFFFSLSLSLSFCRPAFPSIYSPWVTEEHCLMW